MAIKKLSLLPAGRCLVDGTILDTRMEHGRLTVSLPVWVYLIDTTEGPILIDTGMPESCVQDPLGLFGGMSDGSIAPQMKEEDTILNILHCQGYQLNDLACLISSHLHFDHAGGNAMFPNTEIYLQRAEFDAAMKEQGYPEVCKRLGLNYKWGDGDKELVPGLQLLATHGHSPGHQSVLVQTKESGNILLTIDAAYTRSNYEYNVPFAIHNVEDTINSITKLKEIAKSEKVNVFYGHDVEQEKEWSDQLIIY